jgi:hypothetical protein
MTKPNADKTVSINQEGIREANLPLRDWMLLPLLGLLTGCILLVVTTFAAGRVFTRASDLEKCIASNDRSIGTRRIPNSVCWEKTYESPMVQYRFNSSGYRADSDFKTKVSGTYRIVMVGPSFAMGYGVEREQGFASLLPGELSRHTGRSVELYNQSLTGPGGSPHSVAVRFSEILAAQPDMVLWIVTPWDILHASDMVPDTEDKVGHPGAAILEARQALANHSIWDALRILRDAALRKMRDSFEDSSAGSLLMHYVYESQSQFVRSFLKRGDDAGFLKADFDWEWQGRLRQSEVDAAYIGGRSRAAGVPFVVAFLPDRAQAAMVSMGEWPAGYDPYKLDNDLRSIITSNGGIYIDILPGFRKIPNPEQYYYPIDGHPDARGHKILADLLARELTSGAIPALEPVTQPQAILDKGK